jgi:UDP-N-acetyl-2-amino-2-deoxyglucuronate dehydrogenase
MNSTSPLNFGLIGAAGFVAPRHLQAIRDTGQRLVAATDPHDSVGVLDRYFREVKYFPEIERFDRHLEKLRQGAAVNQVHWVSICSPNFLHDAHIRLALRVGAQAICEKPLVVNPWNLDQLARVEKDTGGRVYSVLQLRLHPDLIALKKKLAAASQDKRHQVELTYVTGRGPWYQQSWKGTIERSGGLATNIGIHLFDLLLWLFGPTQRLELHLGEPTRMSGLLELARADVTWFLSVEPGDLPQRTEPGQLPVVRQLTVDGTVCEINAQFHELHTLLYAATLAGEGFGIEDARPSIELAHDIRHTAVAANPSTVHPLLKSR